MSIVDYYNVSQMEDDLFEAAVEEPFEVRSYAFLIVIVCLRLALTLVVVSADIFLLYVMCRFKKLRTRLNMYIFNCFMLHILVNFKEPLIYIIFYLIFQIQNAYLCVEVESQTTAMILYFIFAFILAVDWFISGYKPHFVKMYSKFYAYFIIGLYVAFGIEWAVRTGLCFTYEFSYLSSDNSHVMVRTIVYIICLIGLTILNILKKKVLSNRDSLKTTYAITAANIIIFSFVPMLVYYLLSELFILHIILEYVVSYTEFIPHWLALVHPILIIYVLGRQNKYFKIAYDRSLKRSVTTYESEDLSDEENDIENVPSDKESPKENDRHDQTTALVL